VNFKFGVIYGKPGQTTDDELLSNCGGSEKFDQFLQLLGNKVTRGTFSSRTLLESDLTLSQWFFALKMTFSSTWEKRRRREWIKISSSLMNVITSSALRSYKE